MKQKTTLVIGASENPERYSYKAIHQLRKQNYDVKAIGNKTGKVLDVDIIKEKIFFEHIDTITMYIGIAHQLAYYDYILALNPKRILFNPGTENPAFYLMAKKQGIQCIEACTLVLLATGQY